MRHFMLVAALLGGLPALAQAQATPGYTPGFYTTTSSSTATSATDPVTGVTTTTTNTSTNTPVGLLNTRDRTARNRDYWRGRGDEGRTSDTEARYPYDNTGGRNRSDVDGVRSGFDDPRNPWDGRYMNDNPRNSAGGPGSNETVNQMRGSEPNARYRPGRYGTRSAGSL